MISLLYTIHKSVESFNVYINITILLVDFDILLEEKGTKENLFSLQSA